MRKKWTKLLIASISISMSSLIYVNGMQINAQEEGETSFEYKKFPTEEEYEKELDQQMDRVYAQLKGHIQNENLCPIPGIINTTYAKDSQVKSSAYYVPQGLCQTEDYIVITGYHNGKIGSKSKEDNKGWDSVLYILDVKSHELITTLGLPQAYHNGGIAYDGENMWFCGNTSSKYLKKGKPFVQCMKYEKLVDIVNASGIYGQIPKEAVSEQISIDNVPSFLECDKGVLWVGTYINNTTNADGYAIGYPIQNIEDENPSLNKLNVLRINGIPSSSQGMDIDNGELYVSSSGQGGANWVSSSFITRFDISALNGGSNFLDLNGQFVSQIEVPKMNEEIIVDKNTVYMVFEACAEAYLKGMPTGMKTDRILPIDRSLWE
ncbi:MAG: hypothetical protein KBT48_10265 [Firmicutes bacterium]|nr:hypothetical protein [Bacillota bacterium]